MSTVTLQDAQAKLSELIHRLSPGDAIVITENNEPVAMLVTPQSEKCTPIAGTGKGTLTILAEDDEHLEDFEKRVKS